MKAHMYIISTGVFAFGILGGNLTFNILQCKQWNSTNVTNNVVDHVCLQEGCNATCHTSSKRIYMLFKILCTLIARCISNSKSMDNTDCGFLYYVLLSDVTSSTS